MGTRSGKHRLPSAEDVLIGRATATMEQLFELIHLVNPTGKEGNERQRAERYATKGRLQSLLLERHLDALEVEADPSAGEGIITIRHRQSRRDACHARVADLTPAARFQVQLRWDLAGHEAERPEPKPLERSRSNEASTPATGSVADLLARGDGALAEFDFDRARADFTAALQSAMRAGSEAATVQSACRLLELLIDQLAETGEALSWQSQLPPPALSDPTVRCLLALAAVREGQAELGASLVAGIEVPRTGEVHVELARAALDRGALARCEDHLAQVPPTGEYGDAARRVLVLLQQKKVEAAAALELRLPAVVASNQFDDARALAREILVLHPGSDPARRTLRELARHEQAQRLAAAALGIERAMATGSGEHAARLLQAEPELAAFYPDLPQRVAEACAREVAERRRAHADQLGTALDQGITPAAVEAYWAADEAIRAAVRERIRSRALYWLDELGPAGSRTPARTVAAVTALVRLEQPADPDQNAALLDELTTHEGLLHKCPAAVRLLHDVRGRLAEQQRVAAEDRLAAVEAAIGSDLATARASLSGLDERALDEPGRQRLATVQARLEAAEADAALKDRYEQSLAAGNLLEARSAAAALAGRSDPTAMGAWRTRVEQLSDRIRATWIRQTLVGSAVTAHLGDVSLPMIESSPNVWLLPGGRHLVLVSSFGHWLFVRLLDLEDEPRSSAVAIRTPEPMAFCHWQVDGATVWIHDDLGHVLQLGLRPWEILRWKCLREVRGLPDPIGECALVDARHLWVRTDRPQSSDHNEYNYVVEVDSWRIGRRIECFLTNTIHGAGPPCVAIETDNDRILLADARGATIWRAGDSEERLEGAVVHPTGRGVLLLTGSATEVDDAGNPAFVLHEVEPRGRPAAQLRIDDLDPDPVHVLATSLAQGLTFLYYPQNDGPDEPWTKMVIEANDAGLAVRHRGPVACTPFLVQDPASDRIVALHVDGTRMRAVELAPDGNEAETGDADRWRLQISSPEPLHLCRWDSDLMGDVHELSSSLRDFEGDSLGQAIRELLRERSDPRELVALLLSIPPHASQPARDLVVVRLTAQCERGESFAAFGLAEHAGRCGQWAKALEWLAPIDLALLPPACQQHVHHLRGYGLLRLGDEAAAQEAFRLAGACEVESCVLDDWPELVEGLMEPLEVVADVGESSSARMLVRVIRAADRALEGGDAGAAIAALDHRVAWAIRDTQVLARRAEAWLGVDAGDPAQEFRKRLALAACVAEQAEGIGGLVYLGRVTWPAARIEEVVRRAREWLER